MSDGLGGDLLSVGEPWEYVIIVVPSEVREIIERESEIVWEVNFDSRVHNILALDSAIDAVEV